MEMRNGIVVMSESACVVSQDIDFLAAVDKEERNKVTLKYINFLNFLLVWPSVALFSVSSLAFHLGKFQSSSGNSLVLTLG